MNVDGGVMDARCVDNQVGDEGMRGLGPHLPASLMSLNISGGSACCAWMC